MEPVRGIKKLGDWLAVNGEGIFETEPWVRASPDGSASGIRFTRKAGVLYALTRCQAN
jgi:alpha-L-fucosidase